MASINVSLTEMLANYVRRQVESGRYASASEVVREALRRLQEWEERELLADSAGVERRLAALDPAQLEDTRRKIRQGLDDIAAGRSEELTPELTARIKARGRRALAKRSQSRP